MKEKMKIFLKILKYITIAILIIIAFILVLHFIGSSINRKTPSKGINESMYVDINGTKQWINIYGENKDNPVLLYLHGGPGSSTSDIDYAFTRKWADVYTIVTWDQRNCGKSYDKNQNNIVITKDLLMTDGKEMTEFLLKHLSKEKITILGHSWGSIYGANLVLEYPEYYDAFIGTGQLVDSDENEKRFKEEATKWAKGDEESMKMVEQLTPEKTTIEHYMVKNTLMNKYGYGMMKDGTDYNLFTTILFNPNYTVVDWFKYFFRDASVYMKFDMSDEFKMFSLKDRYDYSIPYYNINGNKDYQTNFKLAEEYFEKVNAPKKKLYIMEDTSHGLLESKSNEFSKILHEIANEQNAN